MFNPSPLPVASRAELVAALEHADAPSLALTLAHLTGDPSVLPALGGGGSWLTTPQGGIPPRERARLRSLAAEVLAPGGAAERAGDALPEPGLLRALTRWALGEDTTALLPMIAEDLAGARTDPKRPRWRRQPGSRLSVAIVGAGMSGLLAAHRLAQAEVPFEIYEMGEDVGGTWQHNDYPGCRTDVPSQLYHYSFAARTDWPDHFCEREVVQGYFRDFAKEFRLVEHIRFRTEVTEAAWDEEEALWRLRMRTPEGEREARAAVLVCATGQLCRPSFPAIPGRDSFAGLSLHSARWEPGTDLTGRRVALIGTGASAAQIVPAIAGRTARLSVFQRTAPWLRPTPHYRAPVPEAERWLLEHVPFYREWQRFWLFAPGIGERGVLDGWIVDPGHPPTERAVSARNEALRAALLASMTAQVADDPELLARVVPDYPVGAKRVLRDDGSWLRTLRRPDVRLVTERISGIAPDAVLTADGERHEVDAIVWATGFRASEFMAPMRITGRGGTELSESWNGDARAYLGLTVPGFPNFFLLYGPNTNLAGQGGSIFYFSECGTTYLLDALRVLQESGARSAEVRGGIHDHYNAWVDQGNALRPWGFSGTTSWLRNAHGRSAQNWPYSAAEYWRLTRGFNPEEYLIR
ncbi:NAD(P)/FAD-dependent oxidoreductase [Streptomyces sp. DSM 44917]|uniref:NAD(P)/FAD-dependent oxidoreductase n=1 Tax=Streptomyces boetiae TaxID=3075541 RepID=A0ABU2L4K6_9ACTN|nr:NAD(P)/FAD-dependent oxidoreductase [Streptomyces sp. DSM 44917]MDT0306489.1 NAD(P)/FAD-dependent oxidoreductase [Streptomyces sp. DSM 44917]